jgi:hypothetical protein
MMVGKRLLAATLFVIEHKMDAVLIFGLAGEVPLVSTDGG